MNQLVGYERCFTVVQTVHLQGCQLTCPIIDLLRERAALVDCLPSDFLPRKSFMQMQRFPPKTAQYHLVDHIEATVQLL